MSEIRTQSTKKITPEHVEINEELDRLLNNGVSRKTPNYDLINIDRAC